MRRYLITGITGKIGSNILQFLDHFTHNDQVVAMVRDKNTVVGVNTICGDIRWQHSCDRAMKGVTDVIHLAAFVSFSDKDYINTWWTNFEGTRNLIRSAEKENVKRFTFVSSALTRGIAMDPNYKVKVTDRKKNILLPPAYIESKLAAEQKLSTSLIPVQKVLYLTSANIAWFIDWYEKYPVVPCPPGGTSVIDPSDAALEVLYLHKYGTDQRAIVGSYNISYYDLFSKIREIHTIKKPIIKIPQWSKKYAVKFASGKIMSRFNIQMVYHYKYFEMSHTLERQTLDETIKRAITKEVL